MTDVFTKQKRSEVMSKIRPRNNRNTELALLSIFRANKIRGWRRNQPVFGRPDFVFPASRTAAFVDGCFWHSCPKCKLIPKQNALFWRKKLSANRLRDKTVNRILGRRGWKVVRIRECDMNREKVMERKIKAIEVVNCR